MRERGIDSGGLQVFANTEVTGMDVEHGRIRRVRTSRGVIEAEVVAIACGVWSPIQAKMAGAHIPLTPAVHQMIDIGPIPIFEHTTSEIAFPIVRRVFGGLVANELVSIQPMSLPSGLLFYLDYTYGSNVGGKAGVDLSSTATESTYRAGQSIYNNPSGKGVQSGSLAVGGMYDLAGVGYSAPRKEAQAAPFFITAASSPNSDEEQMP